MSSLGDTKSIEKVGENSVKKLVEKNGQNDSLERIVDVMRENQKFLLDDSEPGKTKSVSREVLRLIADMNRYVNYFMEGGEFPQRYANSCIRPYVFLILRPFSYAMFTDLLASNVVACFMELRLMVESWSSSTMRI